MWLTRYDYISFTRSFSKISSSFFFRIAHEFFFIFFSLRTFPVHNLYTIFIPSIYLIFTTETDRGGSRSISYGANNDNRQGRRGTRGSRHISGVYSFNAFGETLPPLYIFDSSSKKQNFKITHEWCHDLPKVCFIKYIFNIIGIKYLQNLPFLTFFLTFFYNIDLYLRLQEDMAEKKK